MRTCPRERALHTQRATAEIRTFCALPTACRRPPTAHCRLTSSPSDIAPLHHAVRNRRADEEVQATDHRAVNKGHIEVRLGPESVPCAERRRDQQSTERLGPVNERAELHGHCDGD